MNRTQAAIDPGEELALVANASELPSGLSFFSHSRQTHREGW